MDGPGPSPTLSRDGHSRMGLGVHRKLAQGLRFKWSVVAGALGPRCGWGSEGSGQGSVPGTARSRLSFLGCKIGILKGLGGRSSRCCAVSDVVQRPSAGSRRLL